MARRGAGIAGVLEREHRTLSHSLSVMTSMTSFLMLPRTHSRSAPPKSLSKKSRLRTCVSDFIGKSAVNPQVWWRLILIYRSFSRAAAGNSSRNRFRTEAQAGISALATKLTTALDPAGAYPHSAECRITRYPREGLLSR